MGRVVEVGDNPPCYIHSTWPAGSKYSWAPPLSSSSRCRCQVNLVKGTDKKRWKIIVTQTMPWGGPEV